MPKIPKGKPKPKPISLDDDKVVGISTIIDQLGRVKAKIADLRYEEDRYKSVLRESGIEEAEGRLFRCTVSRFSVEVIDYDGLLTELKPSRRLLRKYTTQQDRVSVRVTSRNGGRLR